MSKSLIEKSKKFQPDMCCSPPQANASLVHVDLCQNMVKEGSADRGWCPKTLHTRAVSGSISTWLRLGSCCTGLGHGAGTITVFAYLASTETEHMC